MLNFTASSQQQSEETCRALDALISQAHPLLGRCIKDPSCTMVRCVSTASTSGVTIFPCTNPITVQVFTDSLLGFNVNLTRSATVRLSGVSQVVVFLAQIDGGIRFGVSVIARYVLIDLSNCGVIHCS